MSLPTERAAPDPDRDFSLVRSCLERGAHEGVSPLRVELRGGVAGPADANSASATPTEVAATALTLADAATSYVERTVAGVVSANVYGFTTGCLPLWKITTLDGRISAVQDCRRLAIPPIAALPTVWWFDGAGVSTPSTAYGKPGDAAIVYTADPAKYALFQRTDTPAWVARVDTRGA